MIYVSSLVIIFEVQTVNFSFNHHTIFTVICSLSLDLIWTRLTLIPELYYYNIHVYFLSFIIHINSPDIWYFWGSVRKSLVHINAQTLDCFWGSIFDLRAKIGLFFFFGSIFYLRANIGLFLGSIFDLRANIWLFYRVNILCEGQYLIVLRVISQTTTCSPSPDKSAVIARSVACQRQHKHFFFISNFPLFLSIFF